ncbi:MAG: hypothetical protein IJQ68_03620 [Methanobrevibacter sp.]|nr:hypothetical protein [Methanobrevibacter sp.]
MVYIDFKSTVFPVTDVYNFTINFSAMPTKMAEIIVPKPTLPRECMKNRHVIADITTIVTSNPILTFENFLLKTIETACMAPSPARGIRLGGKYRNIPNAIVKILIIIYINDIKKLVDSGMKDNI